jgi:hypothetical protein
MVFSCTLCIREEMETWDGLKQVIGQHYEYSGGLQPEPMGMIVRHSILPLLLGLAFTLIATAIPAPGLALTAREATGLNPAPQLEPGKARIVPLASLPPALKRVVEDEVRRLREGKGVLHGEMPAEEAQGLAELPQRVRPPAEVEGHTRTPLADVSRTALAGYRLHGIIPEGPGKRPPWSTVTRLWERPDGVLVTLHEWDYVADGGGILSVRELMNASVRGRPAQFAIRRSAAGKVVSELRWVTNRHIYTLGVQEDVLAAAPAYGKAWLSGIAESIDQGRLSEP